MNEHAPEHHEELPEVPPERPVGTVLVGCFVLGVFALILLVVLSVVGGAASTG